MTYFVIAIILWNIISFVLMYTDKRKARKGKWRISEKTLLVMAFLLGAVGTLTGVIALRHKSKKRKFKALLALALVLNIIFFAFAGYLSKEVPADAQALNAMHSDLYISVEDTGGLITFTPQQQEVKAGLIYYPGAQIAPEAFAYAARGIADAGYFVAIVKMPFDLAIFGQGKADTVIAAYPDIDTWYISGFSLGGVAASGYLADSLPDSVRGLILMASYPADSSDLSESGYPVLSLSGQNDGLATPEKIDETKRLLPGDTIYIEIPGANHTGFALYGGDALQSGDNPADISKLQQQKTVIQEITAFLDTLQEG